MTLRRALVPVLVGGLAVVVAACTAIFDEPVQCTTDADCAGFSGATCDQSHGVCVKRAPEFPLPIEDRADARPSSSGNDASTPTPSPCDAPNKPREELTEVATSMRLGCEKDWVLKGSVYVRSGATLTIDAGTRVLGDLVSRGALFVQQGAKLVAEGTASRPVVFTSSQPEAQRAVGDWRGVVIVGKAPGNVSRLLEDSALSYGGTDANDSSGSLRYVRIEYAQLGVKMGGVGRGTVVDFVQVRKPGDNCFEIFGGTFRAKHLACQYPSDDAFEWSNGYDGAAQFLVAQRTPLLGNEHHGVLVDAARVALSNLTLCGADLANEGFGIVLRNGARATIQNGIVTGWAAGVDVRDAPATPLEIRTTTFFGNSGADYAYVETSTGSGNTSDDDTGFDEIAWLSDPGRRNGKTNPGIARCFEPTNPDFVPTATLPAEAPNDPSFDTSATFAGAVSRGAAWTTAPWLVWDSR